MNTDQKVQLGRRAMYSFMGAGAYGDSGLNPVVSSKMWKAFPLPRLIYGLEVFRVSPAEISKLDGLQRNTIIRLLLLPQNTAITAVYGRSWVSVYIYIYQLSAWP